MGNANVFKFKRCTVQEFVQETPATEWNINHNMDNYPVIDIFYNDNGTLTKMIPAGITFVDLNNTTITFSSARAGVARLVG